MNNPCATKRGLHPRNRHNQRYNFDALCAQYPALREFVRPSPVGELTLDFADPAAVKTLNQALLAFFMA